MDDDVRGVSKGQPFRPAAPGSRRYSPSAVPRSDCRSGAPDAGGRYDAGGSRA